MANFILDSIDGIIGNGNDQLLEIGVENEPPVANDDEFTTEENESLIISEAALLENDEDEDGDILSVVDTSNVENGDLVENPEDTFFGAIEHVGTVTFNDAITVGDFTIGFDPARIGGERSGFFVADNVDLDTILFDLSTPGTLELGEDEGIIADSDLLVSEEFAAILEAPEFAGADLTGADVGDARSDFDLTESQPGVRTVEGGVTSVDLDNTLLEDAANLVVSGADSDAAAADGFDVGFEIVDATDFGLVEGRSFTFTPDEDFSGDASFDYTISDGLEEDTATVDITVEPAVEEPEPAINNVDVAPDPVDEGGTTTITVETVDIADGETVDYELSGDNIDADDFGIPLTGTIAISNNTGSLDIPVLEDQATEGEETFTTSISFAGAAPVEEDTVINDTSVDQVNENIFNVGEDVIGDLTGNGIIDRIVFDIDSSSGLAVQQEGAEGEVTITGFDPAEDILQFDDANAGSTLAAADFREGAADDDGAEIQSIGILGRSVVTLEPDAELNQGTITLLGVTDADAVNIEVI